MLNSHQTILSGFKQITQYVSDALWIVNGRTGEIIEANAKALALISESHNANSFKELVQNVEEFSSALKRLCRSTNLSPLSLIFKDGTKRVCEGALLQASVENQPPLVLIRCLENQQNLKQFSLLTQEIEKQKIAVEQLQLQIIQRQKIEKDLLKAKEQAEAANYAKSRFLANISHELRTPLNGILGYAQILGRYKDLLPDVQDSIKTIHRCGEYLLTLINDVLDFSKLETDRIELYPSDINLNNFLEYIVSFFKERAKQSGLAFNFELQSALPIIVIADEKRLRQILMNLLSNAIKFTPHGGVTFYVAYHPPYFQFDILDTGIGISAENLEKIFQPFHQISDIQNKAEGTGLGLSISRRLVKLMNGELRVESTLQKGSHFTVILPLPLSECPLITPAPVPLLRKIKQYQPVVLVVDDHWENRAVLVNLLQPLGFQLVEAQNGQEALDLLETVHPEVILTDLVMPILDGFSLARAVRQLDAFKNIAIIAISASIYDEHQHFSIEAGCDAFLAKPVKLETLLELLQKALKLEWEYSEPVLEASTEIQDVINTAEILSDLKQLEHEVLLKLFSLSFHGDVTGLNNYLQQTLLPPVLLNALKNYLKNFDLDEVCYLIRPLLSETELTELESY